MSKSFGSPFLYLPEKLKVGKDLKLEQEAADLAWVNDDFAMLFYMKSGKASLRAKIEKNLKEALKYKNRWNRDLPNLNFRGTNRFGDKIECKYSDMKKLVYLSVVSDECGILPINTDHWSSKEIYLNIPEGLIRIVADFSGSMIDMLFIIDQFINFFPYKMMSKQKGYQELVLLAHQYFSISLQKLKINNFEDGFFMQAMHKYLDCLKMPHTTVGMTQNSESRREIARVFGDLMLLEFMDLTSFSFETIQRSNPPNFTHWVVGKIKSYYHSFVVCTVNFAADKGFKDSIDKALEAAKGKDGEPDSVLLVYGDMAGINDYRIPISIMLPRVRDSRPSHGHILFKSIAESFLT